MRLRLAPSLVLLALLLPPTASAQADARLAYLTRQLKTAKDARVRAQSATLLGQMDEASAVGALCDGLEDDSDVVRTAAARSLEQVGEVESIGCLKKHSGDSSNAVRQAVARALQSIEASKNRKPVLYISLKPLKTKGIDLEPSLISMAEQKLKKSLNRKGALFAPDGESKTAAKSVLKAKKLRGFMLMPELQGEGSGLRIRILCLTYPEQSILGEVDVKASGGKPADLIRALAPRVVDEATEMIESRED